jgi:ankyrin repeat protein
VALTRCSNESSHGRTALHQAVSALSPAGDLAVVRLLIRSGADVDARDDGGATPLHLAALAGAPDAIRLLLASGAHHDILDNDGAPAAALCTGRTRG